MQRSDARSLSLSSAEAGSLQGMLLNLIKAYMGTGLLGIPWAIQQAGVFAGLLSMCIICYLLNHTMKMLLRIKIRVDESQEEHSIKLKPAEVDHHPLLVSSETESEGENSSKEEVLSFPPKPAGFPEVGRFCFGEMGSRAINLAVLGTNIGISFGYLLMMSKLMKETFKDAETNAAPTWLMPFQGDEFPIFLRNVNSVSICLYPGLVWINLLEVTKLNFTSLLGNAAVFGMVALSIYISIATIFIDDPSPRSSLVKRTSVEEAGSLSGYFSSFGTFMFSFVMHGTVLSQYDSLPPSFKTGHASSEPRQKPFRILNLAAALVAGVYCVYALFAYFAFANGKGLQDNIMDTLLKYSTRDAFPLRYHAVNFTNVLLSAAIFCSVPLFLAPVYGLLGMDTLGKASLLFFLTILSNVVPPDHANNLLSLVGALCMSWLGCILPAVFYMRLAKMDRRTPRGREEEGFETSYRFRGNSKDGILCGITLVVGMIGMVVGTKEAVTKLVK